MIDYLAQLKAEESGKAPTPPTAKTAKRAFDSKDSSRGERFPENSAPIALANEPGAAFRRWLIDGREAAYSPPVSAEQLRRWYPAAELEPIPDDRTPPPEAAGADGTDRPAMVRAVRLALRGTGLAVEAVIRELTDDELADWRAGWFGPAEIAAFAKAIASRGEP